MMGKPTYVFGCPVCHKTHRSDEPGEPCCTGPSEMRDDHQMQVMRLLKVDRDDANPARAEKRAKGELLMPWHSEQKLQQDARIIIAK